MKIKGRAHAPSLSLMVFPLALPLSLTLSLPCYAIPIYQQTLVKIKYLQICCLSQIA